MLLFPVVCHFMDIKHMVIVYEPPEESRVQRKFRKKTIFNSVYVQ